MPFQFGGRVTAAQAPLASVLPFITKLPPRHRRKPPRGAFPAEELSLIAYEIARDAPFYDATITPEMVEHISEFAREVGTLEGEVKYDQVVATQFAPLWQG